MNDTLHLQEGHSSVSHELSVYIVYAWMVTHRPELLGADAHFLQPLIEHAIYYGSNYGT
jgi:hypothetical protein